MGRIIDMLRDYYPSANPARAAVEFLPPEDRMQFLEEYFEQLKRFYKGDHALQTMKDNLQRILNSSCVLKKSYNDWMEAIRVFCAKNKSQSPEKGRDMPIKTTTAKIVNMPPDAAYFYIECYFDVNIPKFKRIKSECFTENTTVVDITPLYEELREAIRHLPDWQKHFWMSELERYQRERSSLSKVPLPKNMTAESAI